MGGDILERDCVIWKELLLNRALVSKRGFCLKDIQEREDLQDRY